VEPCGNPEIQENVKKTFIKCEQRKPARKIAQDLSNITC
jgi:hypothetical protein